MPRAAHPPEVQRAARKAIRAKDPSRGAQAARKGISTTTKAGAALVSADKPLTEQQRAFTKFWAAGETILSASRKAGYADGGVYAYRLVHQPNVLALYHEEKLKYEAAGQMTRQRVIDGLLEAVDLAKLMAEPSSMIQGWKTVAQMCGYMAPVEVKHHVTHEGKVAMEKLNTLSDAELLELIEKRAALPAPADQSTGEIHDASDAGAAA